MDPPSDQTKPDGVAFSFGAPSAAETQEGALAMSPISNKKKRRKRNLWTPQEDARLKELIVAAGLQDTSTGTSQSANFTQVTLALNTGRTPKQCRDRWNGHLREGIKKGNWTPQEEKLIKEMYQTFGAKWTTMSQVLTDRTDNDIKNKWYSMKRAQDRMMLRGFNEPPAIEILCPWGSAAINQNTSDEPSNTFMPRDWLNKPNDG